MCFSFILFLKYLLRKKRFKIKFIKKEVEFSLVKSSPILLLNLVC